MVYLDERMGDSVQVNRRGYWSTALKGWTGGRRDLVYITGSGKRMGGSLLLCWHAN